VLIHTVEPLLNNSNNNPREVDTNSHPSNNKVATVVSNSSLSTVNLNRDRDKLPLLLEVDPNRASMLPLPVAHPVSRVDMLLLLVLLHLANSNSSMDSRDKDMASKANLVNSKVKANTVNNKDSTASKDKEDQVVFLLSSTANSLLSTKLLLDRVVLPVEVTQAMLASS